MISPTTCILKRTHVGGWFRFFSPFLHLLFFSLVDRYVLGSRISINLSAVDPSIQSGWKFNKSMEKVWVLTENIFSSYNTVQVNKGPFDEGWIMKVKLKDPEEIQSLLDAEKYKQHVEESSHWPFSHPTCTIGTSNFSCCTLGHKICNFHLHIRQLIGGYLCELMSFCLYECGVISRKWAM